jgi:hypothetical protein
MADKTCQQHLSKNRAKVLLSGWDRAIADSEEKIREAKEHIKTLKRGVQHFVAMHASPDIRRLVPGRLARCRVRKWTE